jgi:hypothetical protein
LKRNCTSRRRRLWLGAGNGHLDRFIVLLEVNVVQCWIEFGAEVNRLWNCPDVRYRWI